MASIHPTAVVESGAKLAEDVVVGAHAYVGAEVELAAGVELRPHAMVTGKTTVGEQKRSNVQLKAGTAKEAFVAFRERRDATLAAPALILPALQVNIRAGELPEKEPNGVSYLKIPLDLLGAQR